MTWLVDPETKELLTAKPGERPRPRFPGGWEIERDEDGIPVRMRWVPPEEEDE